MWGSQPCLAQVIGTGSDGVTYTLQDVWSDGAYNAFTDLTNYDGNWYMVFRTASTHGIPPPGQGGYVRVLESTNGQTWTSVALLSGSGDLRDPKISVTPSNQLMIIAGDVSQSDLVQSAAWFSSNGTSWGNENATGIPDYWTWRTVWHNGVGYGITYGPNLGGAPDGSSQTTWLSTTTDGLNYTAPAIQLNPTREQATESGLTFLPNGTAVMLTRCNWDTNSTMGIATAASNYTNWTFTNCNLQVQSPDLLTLPDGRIVAAGRIYSNGLAYTDLSWLDPSTGTVTPFLTFPINASFDDTGYPGVCWYNGKLLVSYYSATATPGADIFVAQVSIPNPSWASAVSGNWSTASNWGGAAPGAVGAVVAFNAPTNSPLTITLDSPQTVGTLQLGNSGSPSVGYTLTGSGTNTLTLNNSGSGAMIAVSNGTHVIDAPVVMADNLVVTGSGTLQFGESSSITESGGHYALTMNGAGVTLILSGSDDYTGGTNVTAGTLALTSNAAIAAGTSLTVTDGGVFLYDPTVATASLGAVSQAAPAFSPVPEPGTPALLAAGLVAGLGLWRGRKGTRDQNL